MNSKQIKTEKKWNLYILLSHYFKVLKFAHIKTAVVAELLYIELYQFYHVSDTTILHSRKGIEYTVSSVA